MENIDLTQQIVPFEEDNASSSCSSSPNASLDGTPAEQNHPHRLDNLPENVHIIRNYYTSLKHCCAVCYAGFSIKGNNPSQPQKPNQDCFIMLEDNMSHSLLIGCLDGHGTNGHHISQFFKEGIIKRLFSHPLFLVDVETAVRSVLKLIELDLFKHHSNQAEYSGTTLSMAIVRGRDVWAVNVGDSRIVLGSKASSNEAKIKHPTEENRASTDPNVSSSPEPNFDIVAHDITVDHKPHLPIEFSRICSKGGRVFSIRYENGEIGPPRVWLTESNVPGLAMSRSLGDFIVHTVGVISTPDVFHYLIDEEEDNFLIVATDGIWDSLKSQEVVDIAKQYDKPAEAVKAILIKSHHRWMEKEQATDDTTICMLYLKGFRPHTGEKNVHHPPQTINHL